jgi:Flp pilus assembly protein TadD
MKFPELKARLQLPDGSETNWHRHINTHPDGTKSQGGWVENDLNLPTFSAMKKRKFKLGLMQESALQPRSSAAEPQLSTEDWLARAMELYKKGHLKEAGAIYQSLSTSYPDHVELMNVLGVINAKQGNTEEGVRLLKRAISIQPNYADAYFNLGLTMQLAAKYAEALPFYNKAIEINPNYNLAYCHRGLTLYHLGQYNDALANFETSIRLLPNYSKSYHNLSIIKLLLGQYGEGWKLYEWRWQSGEMIDNRTRSQPLWLGKESVAGRTILLHAEQGLGDTIQFCRYAPLVEQLGASVVLKVQKPLVRLLKTLRASPNIRIVDQEHDPPQFDCHCPLMSLPLALSTSLDNIPADVPYLFAEPENLTIWRARLGPKSKPRVGLVWSGAADHKNDRNRSISLETLKPLLQYNFEYHAIQKDIRAEDADFLSKSEIVAHGEDLQDFVDTASLISEMDLIISVDTAIVHLAGALRRPVWVMLPFVPDFRWMIGRDDSPWYPSARLFRQSGIGDWASVISKVRTELELFSASAGR